MTFSLFHFFTFSLFHFFTFFTFSLFHMANKPHAPEDTHEAELSAKRCCNSAVATLLTYYVDANVGADHLPSEL
jgi:hypothetical protein